MADSSWPRTRPPRSPLTLSGPPTALAFAAIWLAVLPSTAAAEIPVGPDFLVNSYTLGDQVGQRVEVDGAGRYRVIWQSEGRDGSEAGIWSRLVDSAGTLVGAEIQVNLFTLMDQARPALAVGAAGDFVVVWESTDQDGSARGIFGRRFDSAGFPLLTEFQINLFTEGEQILPDVAIDPDGDFVVVWQSDQQDGDLQGVFALRFDSAGGAQGAEIQVNSHTAQAQREAAVGLDDDGDFVVVWHSYQQDGDGFGTFGRRFDSMGAPQGIEFQVATLTISHQFYPALAVTGDGRFVVAWEDFSDGDGRGISARRFDASATAQGDEFRVNTFTVGFQQGPAVAADEDGDFVVVWHSPQDGENNGIFGQRFDSAGVAQAAELQINSRTASNQRFPDVARSAAGGFLVVWDSQFPVGLRDIVARRFATPATLDVDADGQELALADGLLVLREQFGLTGPVLISGAVNLAGCTRCTAAEIEAYLASIAGPLDIDGDNELEALTDGLLTVRWLFGLTGAALVSGAVDLDNCTRCTAPHIETYFQSLDG